MLKLTEAIILLKCPIFDDGCLLFRNSIDYFLLFYPGIAAFADAHSCIELASSADSFARSHFSDVVQTEEFMMISQSQLLRLIADDGLNVHSEERVFEAVLAWVKYDTTNREVCIFKVACNCASKLRIIDWDKGVVVQK